MRAEDEVRGVEEARGDRLYGYGGVAARGLVGIWKDFGSCSQLDREQLEGFQYML